MGDFFYLEQKSTVHNLKKHCSFTFTMKLIIKHCWKCRVLTEWLTCFQREQYKQKKQNKKPPKKDQNMFIQRMNLQCC